MIARIVIGGRPVVFAASPKVGSTSLFSWVYHVNNGRPYDGNALHHPHLWDPIAVPIGHAEPGAIRVAVHRDGVGRLASAWNHWIALRPDWDRGAELRAAAPDLETFATAWPGLMNRDHLVAHHCGLQARCLGARPDEDYEIICPVSRLDELPAWLETAIGADCPPLPPMPRHNVFPHQLELSARARQILENYTAVDTLLGWDGVTCRHP